MTARADAHVAYENTSTAADALRTAATQAALVGSPDAGELAQAAGEMAVAAAIALRAYRRARRRPALRLVERPPVGGPHDGRHSEPELGERSPPVGVGKL